MKRQKNQKISSLLRVWPQNAVVVYSWLETQGIYRQLAGQYVKSGWIDRIGRGAFKRSGDRVDWMGGVYTLQDQLKMSVHPAGKTALELSGFSHYVPADLKQSKVVLFGAGSEKLPAWFQKYPWQRDVRYVMTDLFEGAQDRGLITYATNNFEIKIASPERAAVEYCFDIPAKESFHEFDQIMSGLTTLRPAVVQHLLENCGSIKAKRLFMYLADKHQHSWVSKLDLANVNFGSGTRAICRNGQYDNKYKLVVPK